MSQEKGLIGGINKDLFPIYDTERKVYTTATPQEIARSWETDFSDPKIHNDASYRYLVHALVGQAARISQMIFVLQTNSFDHSQDIDLLESPLRVAEKKQISCSVIDQEHNDTFAEGGLILATPGANILKISPEDTGTFFLIQIKIEL